MEEATEMWKDFWMVKSFQHERGGIERLKNRREAEKRSKRCRRDRGYFWNGGWRWNGRWWRKRVLYMILIGSRFRC